MEEKKLWKFYLSGWVGTDKKGRDYINISNSKDSGQTLVLKPGETVKLFKSVRDYGPDYSLNIRTDKNSTQLVDPNSSEDRAEAAKKQLKELEEKIIPEDIPF